MRNWRGARVYLAERHYARLEQLIPPVPGLELLWGEWIDDDGVIAAQAVVTTGSETVYRAVLLFPATNSGDDTGEISANARSGSTSISASRDVPASRDAAAAVSSGRAALRTPDGRVNPMILRPFRPAKLIGKAPS